MRRSWIKLYIDQTLRGSCFSEMLPEERFIWFGFLLLAGDNASEGKISVTENTGYSIEQLSDLLKCEPELINRSIKKMVKYEKIQVDKKNVIKIIKWEKYQSEYQRQRKYREEWLQRKKDFKVTAKGDNVECGVDIDIDIDIERDKKKKEKKYKYMDSVLLTKEEHQKLIDKFGETKTNSYIENLNNYIGSKGKKYKSHYFTILNWSKKDISKKENWRTTNA